MRKSIHLLLMAGLFLTVFLSGSALAQLECTDPDLIAVVFENGDINFNPPAGTPFNIDVVLLNPTDANGFNAFEFKLKLPTDTFILSTVLPPNSINIGVGEDFIVGVANCVPPVNTRLTFVTLTLLKVDSNPGEFFFRPTDAPSRPGEIVYQGCAQQGLLIPMYPISGDFLLPVAQINGTPLEYCDPAPPLDMIVDIAFQGDSDNRAATSTGATDGFDVDYDLIDANTTLTFPHPEWGNPAGDNYKQDTRAAYDPTLEMKQWTFTATASTSQSGGEMVTVDFTPNFGTPAPHDFKLRDAGSGQVTDLNTTQSYSYWIGEGTSTRTFELMVGNDNTGPSGFYVDVSASSGSYSDLGNRLGTDLAATDGFDPAFDVPEPGPPPANFLIAYYNQPNWPLGPRFSSDIRQVYDPTLGARGFWPLVVETDQAGPVTLTFDPSFSAGDNYGLFLKDMQSGQTFDLFPGLSYVFQADGISDYEFLITVGAASVPEVDPTSRYLDTGWNMIGLPLAPLAGLGTFDDVILDQAPGYAYLFGYQGAAGYSILQGSDTAALGRGYWMATDTGFDWTMTGTRAVDATELPLNEGWNFIGNPLWFPAPFEGMVVRHGGMSYSWPDAINLGLVSIGVLSYDNATGDYFDAVDLQPWNGYWVNALVTGASLWFDWPNFQVLPARFSAQKSALPIADYTWETEITMVDAARNRKSIVMGVSPEATLGFDPAFDMPQPPSSPNGGSRIAFVRPEWDLAAGDYFSRDIMPEGKDPLIWNAVIKTSNPGKVVLSWNNKDWPEGLDYQIYLPEENRVVVMSMRNQSNLHLEVGNRPVPIVFRTPDMISGVEDVPGMNYEVTVHPNPFNPMTTISFDLPRPAAAEIRIYSVRGELFSVLGAENYPAGRQEVIWNGRDRHGRGAPSGSYFARLYVDGRAMGTVTKMSLVR